MRWRRSIGSWKPQQSRAEREADLDRELAGHIELESEEHLDLVMSPEEARQAARRALGNMTVIKEDAREVWGWMSLQRFAQDLRYGVRTLRKNTGFTTVAVLTLALGIGGCAAMYAFTRQLVLWEYPYPDLGSLVTVEEVDLRDPSSTRGITASAFAELSSRGRSFADISGYNTDGLLSTSGGEVRILEGVLATPNIFEVLGVKPLLGRTFLPDEGLSGDENVVVVGERAWKRDFGGRPEIIGSVLELNKNPYTVIGVMPKAFWHGRDLWIPLGRPPSDAGRLRTWARLKESNAHKQSQAELDVLSARLSRENPQAQGTWKMTPRDPFELSGGQIGVLAAFLVAPVGLVFLIACVNVAHLQLGRHVQRSREMAVRSALGAGRSRLIRQLLTESLLLALLGGVLGVAAASWGVNAIAAYLPAETIEPIGSLELDQSALLFLLLLSAASSVLFGLLPAIRLSGRSPITALKQGLDRHVSSASFRSSLVVSELALSTMLLVGTGMMIVLAQHLTRSDLGFDEQNLWTARLSLRGPNLSDGASRRNWATSALEEVETVAGVVSAAVATELPFTGGHRQRIETDEQLVLHGSAAQAEYRSVSSGYFETLGIPLRLGRGFTDEDREGSVPVVIVNETLARRYFPEGAIGKQLRILPVDNPFGEAESAPSVGREVVGVVADVRQTIGALPTPAIAYAPYLQNPVSPVSLVVRTQLPPDALGRTILEKINAPSPELIALSVFAFERRIHDSVRSQRFLPFSMTVFAVFGLVLAGVGLYGTTSRAAAQRTREFGIRQALGARQADVLKLVMRRSARGGMIGLALGAAGSLLAARLFLATLEPAERAAFGVDLLNASEISYAGLGAAALLIAVILAATYLPARRATKIDPMTALRHE